MSFGIDPVVNVLGERQPQMDPERAAMAKKLWEGALNGTLKEVVSMNGFLDGEENPPAGVRACPPLEPEDPSPEWEVREVPLRPGLVYLTPIPPAPENLVWREKVLRVQPLARLLQIREVLNTAIYDRERQPPATP